MEVELQYSGALFNNPQMIVENVKQVTTTDSNGYWQVSVVANANANLTPANTVYSVATPYRRFQVSIPTGAGPFQASANLANAVSTLSPAATGLTGPITVTGNETVTGTLTVQGAATLQAGATVTGGETLSGALTMSTPASQLIPGGTSFSVRNNANNADNLLVADAGSLTVRNGVTVTAGGETITAGGLTVSSGATSLQAVTAAGLLTANAGLTASGVVTVPDLSFLMRRLQLQNNISRGANSQAAPGSVTITSGTWANYGATYTITPDIASLILVWWQISGAMSIASNLLSRVTFGGAAGLIGFSGAADWAAGFVQTSGFDMFLQSTPGALALQVQLDSTSNATFTPLSSTHATPLSLMALAIPST